MICSTITAGTDVVGFIVSLDTLEVTSRTSFKGPIAQSTASSTGGQWSVVS